MPSLSKLTETEWSRVMASSDTATYRVLERLRCGPLRSDDLPSDLRERLPDLKAARWVEETAGGVVVLTDEGWRHLGSF